MTLFLVTQTPDTDNVAMIRTLGANMREPPGAPCTMEEWQEWVKLVPERDNGRLQAPG